MTSIMSDSEADLEGSQELFDEGDSDYYMSEDSGDGLAYGGGLGSQTLASDPVLGVPRAPYELVSLPELKERYSGMVKQVCDMLGLSRDLAVAALRQFDWDLVRLNEKWFDDPDATKASIGVCATTDTFEDEQVRCPVCFDEHRKTNMLAAACGHHVCRSCCQGYLAANIDEKQKVTQLRCPCHKCDALVPRKVLEAVATPEQVAKLNSYDDDLLVETNSRASWCAGAECSVVAITTGQPPKMPEPLDIICKCGCAYCFTCKQEAHRPVDCETVHKWMVKNSAESENLSWIMVNTKPCPKCQRPIEKNHGCMHMTCSLCRHEFCWLCLGAWTTHGDSTGGYYACNRYEQARREGKYSAEEMRRNNAKASLERYTHYYERWLAHDNARKVAVKSLAEMVDKHLGVVSANTKTPESQLKFILDAHKQVVEARRVLKWTYAYGYYKFDTSMMQPEEDAPHDAKVKLEETCVKINVQKDFFEFLQGEAESSVEPLTRMLEQDLKQFYETGELCPARGKSGEDFSQAGDHTARDATVSAKFADLQQRLITSTKMTENYFEKLVKELQAGLDGISEKYGGGPSVEAGELEAGPSTSC